MRKVTIYTFAAITVLAAAGCKKFDSKSEIIPVTGISLDYDDITLVKGDYAELHATITPSNATGKNVFWSTSGPNIAWFQWRVSNR